MAGISSKAANRLDNKFEYNGKEEQEQEFADGSGLDWYDFGARLNDVQIGRWSQVDPLTEKLFRWSSYASMGNNPIRMKDPDGRKFVNFDQNGNYLNTTKDNWWHNFWNGSKGRVLNSGGRAEMKFNFSDPKNDFADIQSGKIKRIEFVKDGDIDNMMQKAGVFNSSRKSATLGAGNIEYAKKEASGGGKLDFSYTAIPEAYSEASRDPLNPEVPATPVLFLVKGKLSGGRHGTAYNHMNFGNFLTGAALQALGFPETAALLGGQWNSLFGDKNGYPSQFDSADDQNAISDGWNYGMLNHYQTRTIRTKIFVGPLE